MKRLLIKYISIILTIYLLSLVLNTIYIGSISALLLMGFVLVLVNLIIKPLMLLIALPVSLLTLGLFNFIINTLMVIIADSIVTGISMGGFLNSLLASVIISIFSSLLTSAQSP